MGWVPIIVLGAMSMATAIFVLRVPREGWMIFAAALMFGLAGYGVVGSPGQPSAPKAAVANAEQSNEALVAARRSMFADGTPPPPYLVSSDAFARRGQFDRAAGFLRSAVNDNPNDAEAWLALAIALVEHADGQVTPPAISAFSKAQEAFPVHPGAGYFLGLAYLRSGRPIDARRVWLELLERSPDDAPWREDLEFRLAGLEQLISQLNSARVESDAMIVSQ